MGIGTPFMRLLSTAILTIALPGQAAFGLTQILYSDEPAVSGSRYCSVVSDPAIAASGEHCLSMDMPNRWNHKVRLDHPDIFTTDDHILLFQIATPAPIPSGPIELYTQWSGPSDASDPVDITPYLEAPLGSAWQQAAIPVRELKGNYPGMFRHLYLQVPQQNTPTHLLLDNILVRLPAPVAPIGPKDRLIFDDLEELTGLHNGELICDPATAFSKNCFLHMQMPSQWHYRSRIDCTTQAFGQADLLELWVRAPESPITTPIWLSLNYSGPEDESEPVNLIDFISGGIGATWQPVRIPLDDFGQDFSGAFRHIYLACDPSDTPVELQVDFICLRSSQDYQITQVKPLDQYHIRIDTDHLFDQTANDPATYVVEDLCCGAFLPVNQVGLRSWVTGFNGGPEGAIVEHTAYLQLGTPIQTGHTYQVTIADPATTQTALLSLAEESAEAEAIIQRALTSPQSGNSPSDHAAATRVHPGGFGLGMAPRAKIGHLIRELTLQWPTHKSEICTVLDWLAINALPNSTGTIETDTTNPPTRSVSYIDPAGAILAYSPMRASFSFDFTHDVSNSIKVNQIGFLPHSEKRLYVGNYLGDLGPLPLPHQLTAEIVNAETGNVVLQGHLQASTAPDTVLLNGTLRPFSGEEVWTFDFSAVEAPGSYFARVEGVGCSHPFEISPNVFNELAHLTAKALFFQRSGFALKESYAGPWSRPASHLTDDEGNPLVGYIHNSVLERSPDLAADDEQIGAYIDLTGGWFDASDYNKYTTTAARAVSDLLIVYELAPHKFQDNSLNIPESGNGIPDPLDEVIWELDFLAKMVSSNGAAYNKVAYEDWSQTLPHLDQRPMWAITKSTRDTAAACAALAQGARVLHDFVPEKAAFYQAKALAAWACLEATPATYPVPLPGETDSDYGNPAGAPDLGIPGVNSGLYFSSKPDTDYRAWAAVELYRLTADQHYHNAFRSLVIRDDFNGWIDQYWQIPMNINTGLAYLRAPEQDPQLAAQILDRFNALGRQLQRSAESFPYKVSIKSITNIGFGSLGMSSRYSYYLILLHAATGRPEYLELAKTNLDYQLGANPLAQCFITGAGANPVIAPHQKLSELDQVALPIPGISVYGPANSLPGKSYYVPVMDQAYPPFYGTTDQPAYPAARKYTDAFELTKFGEFVIDDLTRTTAVFHYFSQWTE